MSFSKIRSYVKIWIIPLSLIIISAFYASKYTPFSLFQSEVQAESKKSLREPYLSCPLLSRRVRDFLDQHYVYSSFDENISNRTFYGFFKLLDPGKLYFYQSDLDEFARYKNILGKEIYNRDCDFINKVYEKYKERVEAANDVVSDLLKEKFDFTKDEYIETDRKKIVWAKSKEELEDRWRKTLKFIVLNMKDVDGIPKVVKRLQKRYKNISKEVAKRPEDEINAIFLNAFALSLDPHSSFFTPVDNDQFQIDFSLKLVGIGATLMSPDGYTTIEGIVPGGAASRDGRLRKGDKIIAVDSGDDSGMQDIIDMELDKVVRLIRGKEGSIVKLLVLRKEVNGEVKRFPIELTRALVQIKDSEAKSDVLDVKLPDSPKTHKVGIINLPSFYIDYQGCSEDPSNCRSSANDMLREINKLKKQNVDGIIVDLRRNGGGDLNEAQKIVSLFISNPVVVQVQNKHGNVSSLRGRQEAAYTGPLSILIGRFTASASEILAGAVQDYGRGLIVGDSRTFGKGTVQTVIDLDSKQPRGSGGAIHVTIAKFFRPSGKSNQEIGVQSDVRIPDPLDESDVGEAEYDNVLPTSVISASPYFEAAETIPPKLVTELQERSAKRTSGSKEFKEILEAIKKAKENKKTLVSLKEPIVKKDPSKVAQIKDGIDKNDGPISDKSAEDLAESTKVIRKKDAELREAANILADSFNLIETASN